MKTALIARGELRMRLTQLFPEGLLPAESLEFTFEEFQTFSFRNQTPHFFTVYVGIAAEFASGFGAAQKSRCSVGDNFTFSRSWRAKSLD